MSVVVLEYIQQHVLELKQYMNEVTDTLDMVWHEGAIDSLEHVLAKFKVKVDGDKDDMLEFTKEEV
jgi:hypothetical protein